MTINNKRPWKDLNFHDKVFLTASSSAQQLLSPETHSTFIWIMEKEDQLGRCFSGVQRGTLILAQITAALPERIFRSMYPSAQVSLRGGVWLTSKLRQGTWYLREGLWMGKRTWHHILSFCQSRVSGERQHTQEGNSWRDSSRTLNFFSHCKIKRRQKAKILWLDFVCTIVFSHCPWRVQSNSFEIHDPDFLKLEQKANTWYLINSSEENETVHIVPIRATVMSIMDIPTVNRQC